MSNTEYILPSDLSEALELLAKRKGYLTILSGGTNLMVDIRRGKTRPKALLDISHLPLRHIREENGLLRIGALVTINEVLESVLLGGPALILKEAASVFGDPLLRNSATIGGNLADASPAADMAPPLLVLDAVATLESSDHACREISLSEFFLGPRETARNQQELLTEVRFRTPDKNTKTYYYKVGRRAAMAISVVSLSALFTIEDRICKRVRLAAGAIAPVPLRLYEAENILEGKNISQIESSMVTKAMTSAIKPISDIRGDKEYRKIVMENLMAKLLATIQDDFS